MVTQAKTQEDVMSKVMKLLALANDENNSPHERKLAEERAEKLMAQHMIDRFEATERARRGDTQARKPIQDEWSVTMSDAHANDVDSASYGEFDSHMVDMMTYVLEHCGVRINDSFKFSDDCKSRIYQIVGFQEDIMYAERIWFNVFKTFVGNINPQWDLKKSLDENAYIFASAGVSWKQQVLIAEAAGDTRLEWPWRFQNIDPNADFYVKYEFQAGETIDPGNEPWGRSIHKLKRGCKKHADSKGLPYPYASGSKLRVATRNSFARSYRQTIKDRLDEVRSKTENSMASEGNSGKFALALRDTRERVDEEFYRIWPEYDPEVQRRKAEARRAENQKLWDALSPQERAILEREYRKQQRREQAQWERETRKARNGYRAMREDPATRYDAAAWARGQQAARSVNLRNDGEVKEETRRAID